MKAIIDDKEVVFSLTDNEDLICTGLNQYSDKKRLGVIEYLKLSKKTIVLEIKTGFRMKPDVGIYLKQKTF